MQLPNVSTLPKKHKHHTAWNDSDKRRALAVYKSLGSMVKTTEVTGIPDQTLRYWMQQEWWREGMLALKHEDSTQLEEAATSIAKQAQEVVKERLTNGDFVLTKDGTLTRKPVSARDASVINAINIDKRKILHEESLTDKHIHDASERLLKLVEQFARFASAKEIKASVMDAEVIQETKEIHAEQPELQTELQTGSGGGI